MARSSVLQQWIDELPLKMQSTLVLGLRGPDTHCAPEIKKCIRWLRGNVFIPGDPDNLGFMLADDPPQIIERSAIHRELEFCTMHFYGHLMHSFEIVGYMHPNAQTSVTAFHRYRQMAELFHMHVESKPELLERLRPRHWKAQQPQTAKEAFEIAARQTALESLK